MQDAEQDSLKRRRSAPHRSVVVAAGLVPAAALLLGLALVAPATAWEPGADWDAAGVWDPFACDVWQPPDSLEPPSVVFEGLGLSGFQGRGSVASALRRCGAATARGDDAAVEFKGIDVQGPRGRDATPGPLAAEFRSRIDRLDVSAGLAANPERLEQGPSRWTGRIGLTNDRESGRESFEVRTMLVPSDTASTVGVTVGPRLERRLRRGATVFIDGQAEARAIRSAEAGWWSVPGVSDGSLSMLGVTARTGILR